MRKWWSKLKRRLKSVSRRDQTVFYLMWSVFLLFGIWLRMGYPLPTMELEFRRMERQNLLPRSEIIFADTKGIDYSGGENFSVSLWQPTFLGIAGDRVTAAVYVHREQWSAASYPLEEGPTPIPFGSALAILFQPGEMGFRYPLMFVNVPAEAARGEMSLELTYFGADYYWFGRGVDTGNGIWLFPLETPSPSYSDRWWAGGSYTLTLYRTDGSLLLEKSGTLPEE